MKIYMAIDDTDILGSRGTGHLAEDIRRDIVSIFSGTCENISRHQLFVCDDIPYTSHNSSMCFVADIGDDAFEGIVKHTINMLETCSADGSDPGFCIFNLEKLDEEGAGRLMDFGHRAKRTVLTKEEAYGLAAELGIHLSEHGGTGQGIIGALAGTGLRLEGNDGRFRGWIFENADTEMTVRECLEQLPVREVVDLAGAVINGSDLVRLNGKVKTVPRRGRQVLLVKKKKDNGQSFWVNLNRDEIKGLD
ncbi:MAG: hypothetical protein CVV44_03315 [Spirochaetae bacterium HGW-Spirochaetae-1]|jgi:hypothetical protein|nr:MAG: hypothetical protein CVV44_03315 [Spirochaetae bacterium HGW-Spirochaetae-1]